MPNNTNNGGGNGAMTALIAILVIAVIAFGIWYVMKGSAEQNDDADAGLQINLGTTDGPTN